jgi:hypothetical protein
MTSGKKRRGESPTPCTPRTPSNPSKKHRTHTESARRRLFVTARPPTKPVVADDSDEENFWTTPARATPSTFPTSISITPPPKASLSKLSIPTEEPLVYGSGFYNVQTPNRGIVPSTPRSIRTFTVPGAPTHSRSQVRRKFQHLSTLSMVENEISPTHSIKATGAFRGNLTPFLEQARNEMLSCDIPSPTPTSIMPEFTFNTKPLIRLEFSQRIIERVMDFCMGDSRTLVHCMLVSKAWHQAASNVFHSTVTITSDTAINLYYRQLLIPDRAKAVSKATHFILHPTHPLLHERFLPNVIDMLPNLTHVLISGKFTQSAESALILHRLLQNSHLRALVLLNTSIPLDHFKLQHVSHLVILRLEHLPQVTDSILYQTCTTMNHMRSIVVKQCPRVTSNGIGALIMSSPTLYHLELNSLPMVNDDVFRYLMVPLIFVTQTDPNLILRSLHLCHLTALSAKGFLQLLCSTGKLNLHTLSLHGCTGVDSEVLLALANVSAEQLRYLDVRGCTLIHPSALHTFQQNLTQTHLITRQ